MFLGRETAEMPRVNGANSSSMCHRQVNHCILVRSLQLFECSFKRGHLLFKIANGGFGFGIIRLVALDDDSRFSNDDSRFSCLILKNDRALLVVSLQR